MKTFTNSATKSLIGLFIAFSLLIAPAIISAGEGDVTKKDSNSSEETAKPKPLPIALNSAWYNLPTVELQDEETEIENWMKDIHDPFWEEIVNGEPEEEIEDWMVSPNDWETI